MWIRGPYLNIFNMRPSKRTVRSRRTRLGAPTPRRARTRPAGPPPSRCTVATRAARSASAASGGRRGSEIEYLRHRLPDVGHVTALLTDPITPPGRRISTNLGGGPQGAAEVLPGANVRMPHRKPPSRELTDEQEAYNSKLAGDDPPSRTGSARSSRTGYFPTGSAARCTTLASTAPWHSASPT